MWVDTLIAITVVVGLILAIWARISKQSIPELLSSIMELIKDKKEDLTTERYLD